MPDPDVCKDFKDEKIPFKYDLLENEPDASCLFLIRNRFKELKINNFNSLMRFCCEDEERFIRVFNVIETDQYNAKQYTSCPKLHAIIKGVNAALMKDYNTLEKLLALVNTFSSDEIKKLTDALNVDNFVYLKEVFSDSVQEEDSDDQDSNDQDSESTEPIEREQSEQDKIPKQIKQAENPKWSSLTKRGGAGKSEAIKELRVLLIETMRRYKPFKPFNLAQIEGDILKRIKRINKFLKYVSLNRPNAMIKNTKCTVLSFMIHKCNDEKTGRICPEIQPDTKCENCIDRIKKITSEALQQFTICIGLSPKDILKQFENASQKQKLIEQAGESKCNLSMLKNCIETMSNELPKEESLEVITQMSILITAKLISEYAEKAFSECANVDEDAMKQAAEAARIQAAEELAKEKKEAEKAAKKAAEDLKAAQLAAETAEEASRNLAEASRADAENAKAAKNLAEEANAARTKAEEEANKKTQDAELAKKNAEEALAAKTLAESNLASAQNALDTCTADLKKCKEDAANALEKLKEDLSKCQKDLEHEIALHNKARIATDKLKSELEAANTKIKELEGDVKGLKGNVERLKGDVERLEGEAENITHKLDNIQIAKILSVLIDNDKYTLVQNKQNKTPSKGGSDNTTTVKNIMKNTDIISNALNDVNINTKAQLNSLNTKDLDDIIDLSNVTYSFDNGTGSYSKIREPRGKLGIPTDDLVKKFINENNLIKGDFKPKKAMPYFNVLKYYAEKAQDQKSQSKKSNII